MSVLASRYNIIFNRGVCCVGHGKSIVDAINGTDKNTILKVTGCLVKEVAAYVNKDATEMKVHTMKNSKAISPAEDCINLLKTEYSKVQRRTRVKKEGMTIENQYWHLRDRNAKIGVAVFCIVSIGGK